MPVKIKSDQHWMSEMCPRGVFRAVAVGTYEKLPTGIGNCQPMRYEPHPSASTDDHVPYLRRNRLCLLVTVESAPQIV